jgi:hypothetical protein
MMAMIFYDIWDTTTIVGNRVGTKYPSIHNLVDVSDGSKIRKSKDPQPTRTTPRGVGRGHVNH